MTPELLARSGSLEDEVADAASAEWDAACAQYRKHLKEIRTSLPRAVWRLWRRFNLHDAKVLTMAVGETPHLSIFLQVDKPKNPLDQFLEVSYRLAGGPKGGL